MAEFNTRQQINLTKACVVLIDASAHSLDVTAQILKGFGVQSVDRFSNTEDAAEHLRQRVADLVIIDPSIENGAGYDLVIKMRRSNWLNAFTPVILVCGHVHSSDVARGRDTGANFILTKPLSPTVLLQRLMWVVRDQRPFVQAGDFIGPDRRFKFEGPPEGSDGRRAEDLTSPLGEAQQPNLSAEALEAMMKPQRVAL